LVKTLDSVQAQTYRDFHAVICDNGSSDNTSEMIKPYLCDERFTYYKEEYNTPEMFNNIFRNCKTDYLLIVHDDDVLLPSMLEKEIAVLETDKSVCLVSVNINYIDADDNIIKSGVYYNNLINKDILVKSREYLNYYTSGNQLIACPTAMFRMSVIRDNDLFFKYKTVGDACDLFLWFELNQLPFNFYFLIETLYNYRLHSSQVSLYTIALLPQLKLPVYDLLLNNNYSKRKIDSWLGYINNYVIDILLNAEEPVNSMEIIKDYIYIPERPEKLFGMKLNMILKRKSKFILMRKMKKMPKIILKTIFKKLKWIK